jgi:NhaP-type Na+/H+ or K+/H+ antiporter
VSLPFVIESGAPLPYREVIVATAFGVIGLTMVLAQTMGPLARLLRITSDDPQPMLAEVDSALAYAALQRLSQAEEQASDEGEALPRELVTALRSQYEERLGHHLATDTMTASSETQLQLRRTLVRAEQEELIRLRDTEGLPDAIFRPVQHALDLRLQALSEQSAIGGQAPEQGS